MMSDLNMSRRIFSLSLCVLTFLKKNLRDLDVKIHKHALIFFDQNKWRHSALIFDRKLRDFNLTSH